MSASGEPWNVLWSVESGGGADSTEGGGAVALESTVSVSVSGLEGWTPPAFGVPRKGWVKGGDEAWGVERGVVTVSHSALD